MIHFITGYDPATRSNLAVMAAVLSDSDPCGDMATRGALLDRLRADPREPLFAMTHGQPQLLRAHLGEVALTQDDAEAVGSRSVFAWACHTASDLGRELSRQGAVWWGYTGAISAPCDRPEEIPIFTAVFLEIHSRFSSSPETLKALLRGLCDDAAGRLDEVDAAMDSYLCLLHLWDRLRIWGPNEPEAWRHPEAGPPVWMT